MTYEPGIAVWLGGGHDFVCMHANVKANGQTVKLYSERKTAPGNYATNSQMSSIRRSIRGQAKKNGIDPSRLVFPY